MVFGWDYDIGGPEFGGYTNARLGQRVAAGMTPNQSFDGTTAPPAWNLYFAAHAIEGDVAKAVELGATVVVPAMAVGEFGSMAVAVDPGGAGFGLWQAGQHIGTTVSDEPGSAAWFELYAADAKQARDFYTAVCSGATADPMPGGLEYYVLKHGEKMLGGIMQIDPSWGDFHPQWMTYFTVSDADETAALVTRLGGKVLGPIDDSPFGRIAVLMDPYGASFKVLQPPA